VSGEERRGEASKGFEASGLWRQWMMAICIHMRRLKNPGVKENRKPWLFHGMKLISSFSFCQRNSKIKWNYHEVVYICLFK